MNYGCTINLNFTRADRALVEQFRGIPVANIDDCMNRLAALDASICPLNHAPLLGTAFTVRVPAGDNLMFHKAMDLAQPGDVIMIDAGGCMDRAILGELMTTYCKVRGLAGIVVDGCIRDRDELAQMDFPVYARGATPNGPYKNGPGEIGTAVSVGGQLIRQPPSVLAASSSARATLSSATATASLPSVRRTRPRLSKQRRRLSARKPVSCRVSSRGSIPAPG